MKKDKIKERMEVRCLFSLECVPQKEADEVRDELMKRTGGDLIFHSHEDTYYKEVHFVNDKEYVILDAFEPLTESQKEMLDIFVKEEINKKRWT